VELPDQRSKNREAGSVPSGEAHELELLHRTAAHDRKAFEDLYYVYHRRLARFLTRMTRHPELAEEIINDTMWIVWQRAGEFRGSSRVSTWVMGIAYRRALKAFRRASVQLVPVDEAPERASDVDASTEVEGFERIELIAQAIAELPLEQRLVVELTYYLGHSCAEIAEILDCPVNTVKTRMFHARRKLRVRLPVLCGGTLP
jgi:RNA polymerase sigma-70 factor (ECF subfamily)